MNDATSLSPLIHLVDDDEAVRCSLALLIGTVGLRVRAWPGADAFLAGFDPGSVGAVVLDVDVDKKRLSLSIKSYDAATEKEELDRIMKGTRPSTATLGDFININLENK